MSKLKLLAAFTILLSTSVSFGATAGDSNPTAEQLAEMPAIDDRYFSMQIMSQYGIFYLMTGNQFNGRAARSYLLLPTNYDGEIPGEFVTTDVIPAPSNTAYIFVRIAVMEVMPLEKVSRPGSKPVFKTSEKRFRAA
jgi:hypothetical protein